MKTIFYTLLCICFIACASPKKHFTDGNFEKAYSTALKDLKSGKKDRSLKTILNNSLDQLISENEADRNALLISDVIEDWEEAYAITDDLIKLYDAGNRYIDPKFGNTISSLRQDNNALKDDIVISYQELGDVSIEVYEDKGDKRNAQEAYYMYSSALKYKDIEGLNELRDKAEYALEQGTIKVNVVTDAWDIKYNWDIERAFKNLEDNDDLFYEIAFDDWSLETDCQLEIDFARLDEDVREQSSIQTFSEDVEDGYRNEIDTSGNTVRVPIYRTVSGEVVIREEVRVFNWDIRVRTDNGIGYCDFRDNQYRVSREVIITSYETSGDSRAIPSNYRNSPDDIFTSNDRRNIIEDLIREVYSRIESYYF